MAKRKLKLTIPIEKPRNPLIAAMASMRGGTHRKPDKTLRTQAKAELKKTFQADLKNRLFSWPKFKGPFPLVDRYNCQHAL